MNQGKPILLQKHAAHSGNVDRLWMLLPPLVMACYFNGMRPLALCTTALVTAYVCDRLTALLRAQKFDKTENSSYVYALIMTLLMPATVDYYIVVVATCVAILIGKSAFGGYDSIIFHPSALGFCTAAVCWPQVLSQYPMPFTNLEVFSTANAVMVSGAEETLRAGGMPSITLLNLFLGNYAGSMGATATIVLLACAAYLWMRKRFSLQAPLCFLGTCAAIAFFFPRLGEIGITWPWLFFQTRLLVVVYEMLCGSVLFAAVFLVYSPSTHPKNEPSRALYGVLLGVLTMLFRYYGAFDVSLCFAVLGANAFVGILDRVVSNTKRRKEVMNSGKQHDSSR